MADNLKTVTITWEHALLLSDFDSQKEFLKEEGGIYLWVFGKKHPRITYIGETPKYAERFTTHFSLWSSGRYTLFDILKDEDYVTYFKENFSGKELRALDTKRIYIPRNSADKDFSFSETFIDKKWAEWVDSSLENTKFFFGTLDIDGKGVVSSGERKEVEGALIATVRKKYAKMAGYEGKKEFQFYVKDDKKLSLPIGAISKNPTCNMEIKHYGSVKSELPIEISEIRDFKIS